MRSAGLSRVTVTIFDTVLPCSGTETLAVPQKARARAVPVAEVGTASYEHHRRRTKSSHIKAAWRRDSRGINGKASLAQI